MTTQVRRRSNLDFDVVGIVLRDGELEIVECRRRRWAAVWLDVYYAALGEGRRSDIKGGQGGEERGTRAKA